MPVVNKLERGNLMAEKIMETDEENKESDTLEKQMEELTLQHALSKNSIKGLKELNQRFDATPIDPRAKKPELIKNLLPSIPKESINVIIDEAFNPKIRYNAYLATFESEFPQEDQVIQEIQNYNLKYHYNSDESLLVDGYIEKNSIELLRTLGNETTFVFSIHRRELRFDPEARESSPITSIKKIRVVVNSINKLITVFTGDKDYFDKVLVSMYSIFGKSVKAVSLNLTGILPVDTSGFSFHTVKALDYIYHGLTQIGKLGMITAIELDTPSKSKNPQVVKVKGDDLLTDEVICKYLLIHSRDLVGIKAYFTFIIDSNEYKTSIELGLKDSKIKISIKKENYSLDMLDSFFKLLQDNVRTNIENRGLININGLQPILSKLSTLALK